MQRNSKISIFQKYFFNKSIGFNFSHLENKERDSSAEVAGKTGKKQIGDHRWRMIFFK
jgi:hypothetical protein